jgi:hypothetical protein
MKFLIISAPLCLAALPVIAAGPDRMVACGPRRGQRSPRNRRAELFPERGWRSDAACSEREILAPVRSLDSTSRPSATMALWHMASRMTAKASWPAGSFGLRAGPFFQPLSESSWRRTNQNKQSTDIPQMNVGSQRRSGIWIPYGNLEGSESRPAKAERVALSACDMDGRTFIDQ